MVEEFGKRMRDARVAAGYSQRGLAKVLNISVEVLRRVEQGRGYPQLDSAAKIASALGTTVSALLGETEVNEAARVLVQKMTEFGSAEAVKRLRELAEADKDGRVIVLPCKVGDTVYFSDWFGVDPHIVRKVTDPYFYAFDERNPISTVEFYLKDFDKTVFLTREEAEQALKEAQGDG